MLDPRTSMDTSRHGAIQNSFSLFGGGADSTVWMDEEEYIDLDIIEDLFSSGDLTMSVEQEG